jgi:hypothetical protein
MEYGANRYGFGGALNKGSGAAPVSSTSANETEKGEQGGIMGYGGKMYRRPCIAKRMNVKGGEASGEVQPMIFYH